MRAVGAVLLLFAAAPAAAEVLSESGTDLGRVTAIAARGSLEVSVDAAGDTPEATHIIARFQNNQPLMKGRDGLWALWDGDTATLDEAGAVFDGKKITFQLLSEPAEPFFP